jgi:hypothetical protein
VSNAACLLNSTEVLLTRHWLRAGTSMERIDSVGNSGSEIFILLLFFLIFLFYYFIFYLLFYFFDGVENGILHP